MEHDTVTLVKICLKLLKVHDPSGTGTSTAKGEWLLHCITPSVLTNVQILHLVHHLVIYR